MSYFLNKIRRILVELVEYTGMFGLIGLGTAGTTDHEQCARSLCTEHEITLFPALIWGS